MSKGTQLPGQRQKGGAQRGRAKPAITDCGGRNMSRTEVPLARVSSGGVRPPGVEGRSAERFFALASTDDELALSADSLFAQRETVESRGHRLEPGCHGWRWRYARTGDRHLAALLRCHNEVMSGGMDFAVVDSLAQEEVCDGIAGFRHFGLDQAADVFERAASDGTHAWWSTRAGMSRSVIGGRRSLPFDAIAASGRPRCPR